MNYRLTRIHGLAHSGSGFAVEAVKARDYAINPMNRWKPSLRHFSQSRQQLTANR